MFLVKSRGESVFQVEGITKIGNNVENLEPGRWREVVAYKQFSTAEWGMGTSVGLHTSGKLQVSREN